MSNVITLIEKKHEARVSSLVMSEHLGVTHKAVLQLIDNNIAAFQELNPLPFQMAKGELLPQGGRSKATRYAMLTEDQAYFLLALSRNSKRVVELKLNLIQAFGRFRREHQNATDYLPFYHDLHDAIKALTEYAHSNGSVTEAHIFHLTYNKLINKSCGIEAGQRQNLAVNSRVNITNATAAVISTIKRGIEAGADYHDIYHQAKVNVESVTYADKALGNELMANSHKI